MKKRLAKTLKMSFKVAFLAVVAITVWYAYEAYAPAEEEDSLGELPVAVAATKDITVSVQATGVLQPIKVVEIKSKASGEILEMPVEMGDFVEAGDLIAQIDTKILDQELKQVQADHQSAVVRLGIAKNQYERAQSLFAEDLISENELETSQKSYANAEAQMLRSEASLELAKERMADATVRAPSAGTIISKAVEEGQIIASSTNNVSGGTTLVQMADLTELEIRTLVDEVDIGQVRAGLPVESKVEAFPDEQFDGAVAKIEPQAVIQQSVTTFPVLSRIDNSSGKLLPGMNADVSIVVHRRPAVLTIPNEAVRTSREAAEVVQMLGLATDGNGDAEGRDAAASVVVDSGDSAASGSPGASSGSDGRGDSPSTSSRGGAPSRAASDAGRAPAGDDMRARFASMSAAERQRAIAAMREAADKRDSDPFGVAGRREDAVVFVYDQLGQITTRNVVVGVRDWENTEVIAGLEVGDQMVLLPSNSLLRSQAAIRAWASGLSGMPGTRRGGPPPWVRRR